MKKMLPVKQWRWVQGRVPIACIDVLPIEHKSTRDGTLRAVGLILRETPHQGRRWCLIGGRLFRNESLACAVARELREVLGDDISFELGPEPQPVYVAQYFTDIRPDGGHDPRQHALGLTFCVPISGTIKPQGEALDFRWFEDGLLPPQGDFGFDQDRVVSSILERLGR